MNEPIDSEEPTADMRSFARVIRQMYVALVKEGFKSMDALIVIGQVLAANMKPPPQ